MTLCLFDGDGTETQLVLPERDGDVWHGFVPGVTSGQAYGFRVSGPYDRARGQRYNPAKLLLDPYARAIHGDVRFGPELLDYAMDNTDAPSPLDSAGHTPRSLVTAPASKPVSPGPGHALADTILYEVHVRGFTASHPGVPAELRGTYAGLAHEAALQHLVGLGVTAVELLPVHHNVPESFLVERGLTNYWGYNTIGFFAPHAAYSAAVRAGQPGGQVDEFRNMVDALHTAGLEVVLDVVFNHTAEGGAGGPDVVPSRTGQRGVLPPRSERSESLRRHDRMRKLAEHGRCDHVAVDHGLVALLGFRDGRRRLSVRPGADARPRRW